MECPICGAVGASVVLESRSTMAYIRRRRKCLKCELRFTTYEVEADTIAEARGKLEGKKRENMKVRSKT